MSEQLQAPQLGANGQAPAEEPKVVRHVQGTITIVVAIQQGRRSLSTAPLSQFNNAPIPHTREAYAGLYDLIERAMDEVQADVDAPRNNQGPPALGSQAQVPSGSPTGPAGTF